MSRGVKLVRLMSQAGMHTCAHTPTHTHAYAHTHEQYIPDLLSQPAPLRTRTTAPQKPCRERFGGNDDLNIGCHAGSKVAFHEIDCCINQ